MRAALRLPGQLIGLILIGLVRVYQLTISPAAAALFGPACRFHPSCSEYFILAVKKHGPIKGVLKGVARIARCHPWHPGGVDFP